ncbi:endonuclease/exonuclease/phosphatase family protein [Streptomyces sp. NPDC047082]|uniref:endonuclease/exonuclease/phosphatase family protein n=1 Tax=Streptomyces sp. NPDC047082 TaxID=3155259 RepID=UPI0033F76965
MQGAGLGERGGQVPGRAATFGVASLNVCCGLANSLPPVRERAVEFCRRLERADVDIVNFQEVWTPGLLAFLRTQLPSFRFVARKVGALGQPAGGLASFSRLPLRSVQYVSFRGTRPKGGSPFFRAVMAAGACLQGLLVFEVPAFRTVMGNVHLTANRDGQWSAGNRYEALQMQQVRRVHEVLDHSRRMDTALVIACGDFNLPSECGLYGAVVDGGVWQDPFAAENVPTFHADLLPAGARAHRVDYLLVDGDPDRHPVTGIDLLFNEPVALPSGRTAYLSDHVSQVVRIPVPGPPDYGHLTNARSSARRSLQPPYGLDPDAGPEGTYPHGPPKGWHRSPARRTPITAYVGPARTGKTIRALYDSRRTHLGREGLFSGEVYWINARDEESLETGLTHLAMEAGATPRQLQAARDGRKRLEDLALAALEGKRGTREGRFLVLDALDDPEMLARAQSATGILRQGVPHRRFSHIIVTSRISDPGAWRPWIRRMPVGR